MNETITECERLPLVPAMATPMVDVDENVQDRLELPEPDMVLGATLHEVLLVLRLTTPEKPFRAVTVMLDMPVEPTFTLTLVGLATMVKSWIL